MQSLKTLLLTIAGTFGVEATVSFEKLTIQDTKYVTCILTASISSPVASENVAAALSSG